MKDKSSTYIQPGVFLKNMLHPPPGGDVARSLLETCNLHDAVGGFMSMAAALLHVYRGAQMWVSKEVSDDLIMSSIEGVKFDELGWPYDRLEVFFEDPDIPSFLAINSTVMETRDDLHALTGSEVEVRLGGDARRSGVKVEDRVIHLQAEDRNFNHTYVRYPAEKMDMFAAGEDIECAERMPGKFSLPIAEIENDTFKRLALLLFKTLLFASSDGMEVVITTAKPTKAQGGKPGIRGRPKTRRLLVEYLPRHRVIRAQAAAEAMEAGGRRFMGRRGHWRSFKSDKFKKMKGKRTYIFPVPGPDGTVPPRRKFIVRKP